jgi:hypothetical protein
MIAKGEVSRAAQPLKTSWLSNHHTQKETCGHPATTLQETSLLAIQPTRKYLLLLWLSLQQVHI